jgi:hypothetical protein
MAVLSRTSLRRRPVAHGLAGTIALALLVQTGGARGQDSLEVAVKAAYLYKLAPFVGWPAASPDEASAPFTLCVVGADPFGPVLDRAVANQSVDGRAIVIRRMAKADRKSACKILYAGGPPAAVREALQAVDGAPVLTVTDSPATPGIVDFVIDQGRVRFRLDDQAAAQNGLTISSKLLSLAVSVRPRKTPGARP